MFPILSLLKDWFPNLAHNSWITQVLTNQYCFYLLLVFHIFTVYVIRSSGICSFCTDSSWITISFLPLPLSPPFCVFVKGWDVGTLIKIEGKGQVVGLDSPQNGHFSGAHSELRTPRSLQQPIKMLLCSYYKYEITKLFLWNASSV